MSSRAQSESDDGPEPGSGDETPKSEHRSTPEDLVDNTVTRIMPVIAPWPEPGAEPPDPPALPAPRVVGAASVVSRVNVADTAIGAATADVADTADVATTPGTAVVLATRRSVAIERPGPTVLAEDSWDETAGSVLDEPNLDGRHTRLPPRRVWVALVAVLIGLGAVVGVPFVLSSQPGAPPAIAIDESPTEVDEPPPGFVPSSPSAQSSPSPEPLSAGGSATPARSPSPSPSQGQAGNPTTEANTPEPPPFEPLTIEAETGTVGGSAWVWDGYATTASGGLIVRNLGNWGGTPGTLVLSAIAFPNDAEYTITIYFVHPNGETDRTAQVTVEGLDAVTVNFTATSSACCFETAATIAIPAGTRSITFSNPTSHAPSIDRVVITRT